MTLVMIPGAEPYPRYGRVVEKFDSDRVRVTGVHCGDPRCASEHCHGDEVWPAVELIAAGAYQPRAGWEEGRKSCPNAVVS